MLIRSLLENCHSCVVMRYFWLRADFHVTYEVGNVLPHLVELQRCGGLRAVHDEGYVNVYICWGCPSVSEHRSLTTITTDGIGLTHI